MAKVGFVQNEKNPTCKRHDLQNKRLITGGTATTVGYIHEAMFWKYGKVYGVVGIRGYYL